MAESLDWVRFRTIVSNGVDAEFRAVCNALNEAFENCQDISQFDDLVDSHFKTLLNAHMHRFDTTALMAYKTAKANGLKEVRVVFNQEGIFNQEGAFVETNNAIKDVWKKAVDKTKGVFGSFTQTVKDSVRKVLSKKKLLPKKDEPLSPAAIKVVKDVTADTIEKLKAIEKARLQDEVTKAAAEGKLDAYASVGVVSVMVAIDTVHDSRRCKRCGELDGMVLSIEQARALIPCHRNCRCMWVLPKKNAKGATKTLRLEQERQEFKVMKLRERLDRRMKEKQANKGKKQKKVVHNSACSCSECIWNQMHAELMPAPRQFKTGAYVSIRLDSMAVGTHHLVLEDVPFQNRKTKQWVDADLAGGSKLNVGTLLEIKYHNLKTNEMVFNVVGDVVCPDVRDRWQKAMKCGEQTVKLLPESIKEYPYRLASNDNGSIVVIMVNSRKGYVITGGFRSPLVDYDDVLDFVVKAHLTVM